MRKLLIVLLLASPSWAGTWALVQHQPSVCSGGATACAVTVTSTAVGDLLIAIEKSPDTTGADVIASVSDNGAGGACAWTVSASSKGVDSSLGMTEGAYCLSSKSGITSVTVNRTSTAGAWAVEILEYSTTSGPSVFDTAGSADQNTNTTTPSVVALTITGSNDAIIQFGFLVTPTAIGAPYTIRDTSNNLGAGDDLNTAVNGSAATWTQSSGHAALGALAFKETAAAASTVKHRSTNY